VKRFESWAISSTLKEYSLIDTPTDIDVYLEHDGWKRNRKGRSYPVYRVKMRNGRGGKTVVSKKSWALATAKKKAQAIAWSPGWLADVDWFNQE
jgi:hypothetical protein